LLEPARRLFAEHGYSGVSTIEIARAAGVTHGLIQAHFHSKAGLLLELISESNDVQTDAARAVAESSGDCRARLRGVLEVYLTHDLADRELLGVMQAYSWRWPYDLEARNRVQLDGALGPLKIIFAEAVAKGALRRDLDLDLDRAVRAAFAVYTLALRAALFDDASREDCLNEVISQLEILLAGACARA
jgi:AcrR family transcriptional regulator